MNFLEMWYTAANEPLGACFEVTNFDSVKQQLYTARKGVDDPNLANLKITHSPINPNHLWIIKSDKIVAPEKKINLTELNI